MIVRHCAIRQHRHGRYQIPLMHEVIAQTHPPVYSQNLERPHGCTSQRPCQLSYTSLLPVVLNTDVTKNGSPPIIDNVDIRSCVLSLIDLFTHWLSTPMDSLLLLHTISSINLLSDLFSLSSQFEWMLDAYLDLTQTHPQEDVLVESLLVFGVLKSAVVLRVVSAFLLSCFFFNTF